MPPLGGGLVYRDQHAAEAKIGEQRSAAWEFIDQLKQVNEKLDSLTLHNLIAAEEARLRAS